MTLKSSIIIFAGLIPFVDTLPSVAAGTKPAKSRLSEVEDFGPNPGNLAMYKYVPKRKLQKRAALVVALHGCGGSAKQFSAAGFNQLADKYGFFVLYPEQRTENNNIKCFNHSRPNLAAVRVHEAESILQMIKHMLLNHRISRKNIFITGFSSGGQFANILAATYPKTFKAAAIIGAGGYFCRPGHSGIPGFVDCVNEGEDMSEEPDIDAQQPMRWPKISIWHGKHDRNVPYSTMLVAIEQWKTAHGIRRKRQHPLSLPDDIVYDSYKTPDGKVLVESYSMVSRAHTVPVTKDCGIPGGNFTLAKVCFARKAIQFFGIR